MFSVYKTTSVRPGQTVSNRVMVKSFKTKDQMFSFLGKGDNSTIWKETGSEQNLKNGQYKMNTVRGKDGKPAKEFIKLQEDNMREDIKDFILSVGANKSSDAMDSFNSIMNQKVMDAIEAHRPEVASSMFNNQEVTTDGE